MFTNFFGSNLAVEIFLKIDGTTQKGWCVEIEDWGFSVHFVLWFQENSIYTYVLYKVLYKTKVLYTKWCKVFTGTDSWFQKLHEEFGQLQTGSGKCVMRDNSCVLFQMKLYMLLRKVAHQCANF